MTIEQPEYESKGAFFIEENNEMFVEMTYSRACDKLMIIDHNEVSDALRGKGAGKQLVSTALNFAREKKIKILPLCPFAKAVFDKTPELNDVLHR